MWRRKIVQLIVLNNLFRFVFFCNWTVRCEHNLDSVRNKVSNSRFRELLTLFLWLCSSSITKKYNSEQLVHEREINRLTDRMKNIVHAINIAKSVGLLVGNILLYLNGQHLKSTNMNKIKAAIDELGYQENTIAKGFKNNKNFSVVLLINHMSIRLSSQKKLWIVSCWVALR